MATALDYAMDWAGSLAVRLTQGQAVDLSDSEVERALRASVGAGWQRCAGMVRTLRGAGELVRHGDEWRAAHGDYTPTTAPFNLTAIDGVEFCRRCIACLADDPHASSPVTPPEGR